jgi:serine phosphatase RsbU (regulator of sigma subunit)
VAHGELSLCSALCLRLRGDEIVVSAGGHPLPLVVGTDGGLREPGRPGLLLGIPGASGWYDESLTLAVGETLLAYTDGATDARGASGRYGEGRLRELLRAHAGSPPDVLVAALDAELSAFRTGPQADDTAAVAIARRTAPASR